MTDLSESEVCGWEDNSSVFEMTFNNITLCMACAQLRTNGLWDDEIDVRVTATCEHGQHMSNYYHGFTRMSHLLTVTM